ncbi:hypothetical protein [Streptomyces sp. NPDC018693]|uniref:hypothetical protein n=1 Tax=unclassified Streptomyces TaxID=2593676 RepID=UPI003793691A
MIDIPGDPVTGHPGPEALVLDCARRLHADPGGEAAYVWVAGLAQTAPYLAGEPGPEAEGEAVEARLAAAAALGARDCEHAAHPYEEHLDRLAEDECCRQGIPTGYLFADTPERPRPPSARSESRRYAGRRRASLAA